MKSLVRLVGAAVFFAQAFLSAPVQAAYDPTRFLRDPDFNIVQGQTGASGEAKTYLAQGAGAVSYGLDLSSDAPEETNVSLLREALGLPNAPSYPVLIQVGADGLPLTAQINSDVPFEGIVRGALRPQVRSVDFAGRKLPSATLGEYVGHVFVSAITGASTQKILFSDRHFYVGKNFLGGSTIPVGSTPTASKEAAEWMFDALSQSIGFQIYRLQSLEFDGFARSINRFLWCLKNLKPDELRMLLGGSFGTTQELVARVQMLEPALRSALNRMGASAELIEKISARYAASVPPAHVKIPSRNAERLIKMSPAEMKQVPVQLLWALYFNPTNLQLRKLMERSDGTVANLQWVARRNVEEVYVVSHHMQPNFMDPGQDRLPSLADPERNRELLIVMSAGRQDMESQVISNMAARTGANDMRIDDNYRNTNSMLAQEIRRYTFRNGRKIKTIVFVELSDRLHGLRPWLENLGYQVVVVDHHETSEADRSHPRSSLEQMAEMLGYSLSPSEYTVALIDRLGTRGARLLGISDQVLRAQYQDLPESLEGVKPIETSRGRLYITDKPFQSLGRNAHYVGVIEYPRYANVLMISPGLIRFSGHPDTVRELREYFGRDPHGDRRFTYSNGEYGNYWGMRGSGYDFSDVVDSVVWYLKHEYKFPGEAAVIRSAEEPQAAKETPHKLDRTRNAPKEKSKKITPPSLRDNPVALGLMVHLMVCRAALKELFGVEFRFK